jgi:hypothetical protein
MTTKENHDAVIKTLHPFIQAVMKAIEPCEKSKFADKNIIAFGYHSDMGGYNNLEYLDHKYKGEIPEGEDEDENGKSIMSPYEAFDTYCEAVKKNSKNDTFKFDVE